MVIADLNILCIAQQRKSYPENRKRFFIESYDRNAENLRPVYADDRFPMAHALRGWWYRVYPAEPAIYEDTFLDLEDPHSTLRVRPHWADTVEELLSCYLDRSPCGKIAALICLQSERKECVHEACTLSVYMRELKEGNIHYNHLYYIIK